jgi:hypothetical protein
VAASNAHRPTPPTRGCKTIALRATVLEDCGSARNIAVWFCDERGSAVRRDLRASGVLPDAHRAGILRARREMAAASGRTLLVEGSGSSVKTRLLLDRLARPSAYVPVDISREHLLETALALRLDYPGLPVLPVCVDFGAALRAAARRRCRAATARARRSLLRGGRHRWWPASRAGRLAAFLVVWTCEGSRVLERAYDDATA